MKFSIRDYLASGLTDAPISVIKRVELYQSFAIQVVYGTGSVASAGALYSSCNYDPGTGSGNFDLVPDSTQAFDIAAGGSHTWSVHEFLEPYLKIEISGDVQAVYITFVGQPNLARLAQ